jgi:group I intron endonuclease
MEDKYGYIYKLTSRTSNKSYVGQTTLTVEQRFEKHVNKAKNTPNEGCRHLNNAINLYGENDFIVETLGRFLADDLNDMEILLISEHNTLNPLGYNLTIGGGGTNGYKQTQDMVEKMSVLKRKYLVELNLPSNVARWASGKTEGFVVKVRGFEWKYFCDSRKTYDERRIAAIEYRNHLMNGGEQKTRRNKKSDLGYDFPKYVYYKSTQDGFQIDYPNVIKKNFVTRGKFAENLTKAMECYSDAIKDIDEINYAKAQTILEKLRVQFRD